MDEVSETGGARVASNSQGVRAIGRAASAAERAAAERSRTALARLRTAAGERDA